MAYHVTIEHGNGYRCGCCDRVSSRDRWVDTLEEALDLVPTEIPWRAEDGEHSIMDGVDPRSVKVIDGATGEEVAHAHSSWPYGCGKSSLYAATKWSGYRPDVGRFEVIYEGKKKSSKTWDEIVDPLRARNNEYELRKAQIELEEAKKNLARLTAGNSTGK